MPLKTRSECKPEEALNYLNHYFATVDTISSALSKYEILATDSTKSSDRSFYRAKALEAERDLELLKNQRRAFLSDQAGINPPSKQAVAEAEQLAAALAKIAAKEAKASAIIELATKAMDVFTQLHQA